MSKPTFKQAREAIFSDLRSKGWKVVDHLKVPHATSPDGRVRLWFKPQAVWMTCLGLDKISGETRTSHAMRDARSIWSDLRELLLPGEFLAHVERCSR